MKDFKAFFRHTRQKDWNYFYVYLIPTVLVWKSHDADEHYDYDYFGIALKWLTFEVEFRWINYGY